MWIFWESQYGKSFDAFCLFYIFNKFWTDSMRKWWRTDVSRLEMCFFFKKALFAIFKWFFFLFLNKNRFLKLKISRSINWKIRENIKHEDDQQAAFYGHHIGHGHGHGAHGGHDQGHGHHIQQEFQDLQTGYGTKLGLHKLPLLGGLFGPKPSGSAGGTYSGGSANYDPGTTYEFKTVSKEKQYSGEQIGKQGYGYNSAELELQSQSGEKAGKSCKSKLKTPINSSMRCTADACKAKCMADYQFPNGELMITVSCVDGEWIVQGFEWDQLPSCERKTMNAIGNNPKHI